MSYLSAKLMNFNILFGIKLVKHTSRVAFSASRGSRSVGIDHWSSKKNEQIFLCMAMLESIQDGNSDVDYVKGQQLDYWTTELNLFDLIPEATPSDPTMDSSSQLLVHWIGNWDASLNTFPNSGGTGPGTAVARGDFWDISVGGAPGGLDLPAGATIIAKVANPGQVLANWKITY